ncbi:MAG: hypothetical protein ACE5EE_01780 [Fidelibacterota bacterium]
MISIRELGRPLIFGVAFGLVEAAVVIYLRAQFTLNGDLFSLETLPGDIIRLEMIREGATLVLLGVVGVLAGRRPLSRFGAFMMTFATWDIFYYVWLKLFIDWPGSLLEMDVLFLLPVVWIGPVLAPLMVSTAMIICGSWIYLREEKGPPLQVTVVDWLVEIGAAVLIVASFMRCGQQDQPEKFPWMLFLVGLVGGVIYFVWSATTDNRASGK